MEKRSKISALLLCAAMVLAAGCGGKEEAKTEKADIGTEEERQMSESDEYLLWIQEAYAQYEAEKIHGYRSENTEKREDRGSDTYIWIRTIDQNQQQILDKNIESDGGEYISCYTKEGENEYYYTEIITSYTDAGEETKEHYKVLTTDREDMNYSYYVKNE